MKTFLEFIVEAQRYFTQSGFERLKEYKDDPNIFISYRSINKLGINPKNEFNTPIAIYSYNLKDMWSEIEKFKDSSFVPFAGEHPFIYVFKVKPEYTNKVLFDIYKYNSADYDRDIDKLNQFCNTLLDKEKSIDNDFNEHQLYSAIMTLTDRSIRYARVKNPFGFIWYITRELSLILPKITNTYSNSNVTVIWNMLLRKVLGYYGFVDKGQGIIHPSETKQGLFLSKDCIEEIDLIRNVTADKTVRTKPFGTLSKDFDKSELKLYAKVGY